MTTKLKDLLVEVFEDDRPVDKRAVIEGVSQYGIVGKSLYKYYDKWPIIVHSIFVIM